MKKTKVLRIVIFSVLVIAFLIIGIPVYLGSRFGGIKVMSNVPATVHINGTMVGKTPYVGTSKEELVSLQIVPVDKNSKLVAYETKINLVPGIQTVVDRKFGETEDTSSVAVIYFDKTNSSTAQVVLITTPEGAEVIVDGVAQGKAPYIFNKITTGPHIVEVKSPGFTNRVMNIKTLKGLRLNIFVKLAKNKEDQTAQAVLSAETNIEESKKHVVIKSGTAGPLRMWTEAGGKGEEIAEIAPGDKYLHLETDQTSGWYKIQYKEPSSTLPKGIEGWVNSEYSSLTNNP